MLHVYSHQEHILSHETKLYIVIATIAGHNSLFFPHPPPRAVSGTSAHVLWYHVSQSLHKIMSPYKLQNLLHVPFLLRMTLQNLLQSKYNRRSVLWGARYFIIRSIYLAYVEKLPLPSNCTLDNTLPVHSCCNDGERGTKNVYMGLIDRTNTIR